MMASNFLSKFLGMDNSEETEVPESQMEEENNTVQLHANNARYNSNKVISMNTPTSQHAANKIVIFEPRIYSDAKEVGNHLLNNRAVVVNFDHIDAMQARRIIDFLTGAVFAVNGEIKRIGDQIFLCTPANFEIDGNLTQIVGNHSQDDDLDDLN